MKNQVSSTIHEGQAATWLTNSRKRNAPLMRPAFSGSRRPVAEARGHGTAEDRLQRLRRNGELTELLSSTATPCQPDLDVGHGCQRRGRVIGVSLWFPRTGPIFRPRYWLQPPAHSRTPAVTRCRFWHRPLFRTRAEKYDASSKLPATRGASSAGVAFDSRCNRPLPGALSRIKDDDTSERSVAIANLQPSAETASLTYTRTARS